MILRMIGGPYDGSDIRSSEKTPPYGYSFATAPLRWVRDRFSVAAVDDAPLALPAPLPPRQEYRLFGIIERALRSSEDVALYVYANETLRANGFAPPYGMDVLRCYLSQQQRQAIAYSGALTEEAVERVLLGMAQLGLDIVRLHETALDLKRDAR